MMEELAYVDLIFYVIALFCIGVWTIKRFGTAGFTDAGIPFVPRPLARGLAGRLLGSLLILIGAAFVLLSAAGALRLWERLRS